MQLKLGLVVLALGATSVLSYPIDGNRVEFEARDHLVKRHHHHHHYYRPFDYPPQFDFVRFIKSLFHVAERYAGFRRGYNGLVTDLGARGFFDHDPALAVRAPEGGFHEDLEARDSAPAGDRNVNFWTEVAQKEVFPELAVREFSDDLEARNSAALSNDDADFWSDFAQKEAFNPNFDRRGFSDDLKARNSAAPSNDDAIFWSEFAQKEAFNPELAVRGLYDEDLESRDVDGGESEIEMRDGLDELL